jgi:hypothetical protein
MKNSSPKIQNREKVIKNDTFSRFWLQNRENIYKIEL